MARFVSVDTSPTKQVMVDSLTRDASLEACIFDLIDNAIDAAREQNARAKLGADGLPSSYAGFWVKLDFDADSISVKDNAGGMSTPDLSTKNFRFGKRSNHPFGIGLYGVGMNRAIFKFGNDINIATETAKSAVNLAFTRQDYLSDEDDWVLKAVPAKRTGAAGTSITVSELDGPVARQTSDTAWRAKLSKEISERYSIFLEKGLRISIGADAISPSRVEIRTGGPFPPLEKSFKVSSRTRVIVRAGQHNLHRFTAEPDYDAQQNRLIADEYGWSIICNDRVIVMLDTSPKTGWEKKWHNEFSGFVGNVHFVSTDPADLPWNTAKTDIDTHNASYTAVLADMRAFTEAWRKNANQAKKIKKAKGSLKSPAPASPTAKPKPSAPKTTKTAPTKKAAVTTLAFVLPADIDEKYCQDKLLQLVREGQAISIFDHPYTALALARMLFEASARMFLIRHREYDNAKLALIPEREKGRSKPLTARQKSEFVPTMDEIVSYLQVNPGLWRSGTGPHLVHSLNSFARMKTKMNSAIHQPIQLINVTEAVQIRDDLLPLLRHMIEE